MDTADFEVTDDQRINFLAELMNLSVLIEMGATLAPEKRDSLQRARVSRPKASASARRVELGSPRP